MLNIKTKAVNATAKLELNDASGEPLYDRVVISEEDRATANRASITLHGPGSVPFQKAVAARQNRLLERMRKKGKAELSADQQRSEQAGFLASITDSFNHFSYPEAGDGKEMFKAAYADVSIGFIVDQVEAFVGDWGNFTPGSPTN